MTARLIFSIPWMPFPTIGLMSDFLGDVESVMRKTFNLSKGAVAVRETVREGWGGVSTSELKRREKSDNRTCTSDTSRCQELERNIRTDPIRVLLVLVLFLLVFPTNHSVNPLAHTACRRVRMGLNRARSRGHPASGCRGRRRCLHLGFDGRRSSAWKRRREVAFAVDAGGPSAVWVAFSDLVKL